MSEYMVESTIYDDRLVIVLPRRADMPERSFAMENNGTLDLVWLINAAGTIQPEEMYQIIDAVVMHAPLRERDATKGAA